MSYHDRIMNIPTNKQVEEFEVGERIFYKSGHRDARHAAAELAIEADQKIEELKADLDRLHRERDAFQDLARSLAEQCDTLEIQLKGGRAK